MGFKQSKTLARKSECKPALISQSWAAVPQMQLTNGGPGVENLQLHPGKRTLRIEPREEEEKQMKPMDCLTDAPVKMPRVAQKF